MRRFSSAVRRGNSRRFSGTCAMPRATTSYGGTAFRLLSSRKTSPCVDSISLEIRRSSVVLPAPLGPITATDSPALTSRLTPDSAWKPLYPAETLPTPSIGLNFRRVGAELHLDHFRIP